MFHETEYQDTYQTKFLTFVAHVGELPVARAMVVLPDFVGRYQGGQQVSPSPVSYL